MESIMSVIPAVLACPSPSCPTLNARKSIKEDLYWPKAQIRIFIGQNLPTGHRYRLNSLSPPGGLASPYISPYVHCLHNDTER